MPKAAIQTLMSQYHKAQAEIRKQEGKKRDIAKQLDEWLADHDKDTYADSNYTVTRRTRTDTLYSSAAAVALIRQCHPDYGPDAARIAMQVTGGTLAAAKLYLAQRVPKETLEALERELEDIAQHRTTEYLTVKKANEKD